MYGGGGEGVWLGVISWGFYEKESTRSIFVEYHESFPASAVLFFNFIYEQWRSEIMRMTKVQSSCNLTYK